MSEEIMKSKKESSFESTSEGSCTKRIFKILTYNIFMRPPFIKNNENDFKNKRMSLITKIVKDYDIINFQEIFSKFNYRREKLLAKSAKLGLKYQAVPPKQPFWSMYFVGSGLLTISKQPIQKKKFMPFNDSKGIDGIAYKGVLYTKISLGQD